MRGLIGGFRFLPAALFLFALLPRAAAAQCTSLDPPCTDDPPFVHIEPSGGDYTSAGLDVTINWSDEVGLNSSSRVITLNGSSVVGSFTYTGSSTSATSDGSITLASGSNTFYAEICDTGGECSADFAFYDYTPPPPPEQYAKPVVGLGPHHSGFRDVKPGGAVVSYTTPAYVSLDAPRSVTLLHASGQARPMGFVQVNAQDNSTDTPSRMSIRLRALDGAYLTFFDGSQELFFKAGPDRTRLAALFDASGHESFAYSYDVIVSTYWDGAGVKKDSDPYRVRIPIINERGSPYGAGWSVAGLQRLRDQGDGVYILGGDGTATWFAKDGSGAYVAPAGDFSTVAWNGSGWTRTYPDGAKAIFGPSGYLDTMRDRFGNQTSYAYDTSVSPHRLSSITDPVGQQTTFAYTGTGALAWVQDPAGRRVNTTANGNILYRFWDPNGALGLDLQFNSDILLGYWDRGVDRATGDGTRWHFDYDAYKRLSAVTMPTVTANGGSARPVVGYRSIEAAVLADRSSIRVHPDSVRLRITDPNGNATALAVDRYAQPTRVEEPYGRTTLIFRNPDGQVTATVEPSGRETNYGWDGPDLKSIKDREATNIYIDYEATYHQPVKISVGGADIHHAYGASGQLLHTRIVNDTTFYGYDSRYRVTSVRDPEGHTATYTYESGGFQNLVQVTDKDANGSSRTTSATRDGYGRVWTVRSPSGDTTRTEYDLLNRPTSTADALGLGLRGVE